MKEFFNKRPTPITNSQIKQLEDSIESQKKYWNYQKRIYKNLKGFYEISNNDTRGDK